MKVKNDRVFQITLWMAGFALSLSMAFQSVLAKDFAKVSYEGHKVIWDLSLPDGATGVIARVIYTPNDHKADSYLEEVIFREGIISYPFNGKLEDGTYTWELRLLHKGANVVGFKQGVEGPIDENGRQVEIVGKPLPVPEGKIRISNSGRDSMQNGGFRVVEGVIPDFRLEEPIERQEKR